MHNRHANIFFDGQEELPEEEGAAGTSSCYGQVSLCLIGQRVSFLNCSVRCAPRKV